MKTLLIVLMVVVLLGCGGGGGGAKSSVPDMPPAVMPVEPPQEPPPLEEGTLPSDQLPPTEEPMPPEETLHPPVGYANLVISDKGSYRFGGQHYSFMDFGLWVSVRLGRSSRRIASASINGTSPADYRTTISVEDRLPESALRSMGSVVFVGQVRGYLHTSPHHPSFGEARFEVNLDSTAMDIDFTMPSVRVGEGGDITWRGVPIEKTVDWDFQQDEDGEYIRGVFNGRYGILGSFSKQRVTGVFAGVPE